MVSPLASDWSLAGGAGDGSAAYFYGLGHEGAEVFEVLLQEVEGAGG
jgi:hypothetical protein